MKVSPKISVIIPTYNRADMLARVLPSYLRSDMVYEVIIVDDGSNDHTKTMLEYLRDSDSRVRYIRHQTNQGMTYARNTGIEHVQRDLILISEDDLEVAHGTLEILVSHLVNTGADIIAGRRIWMRMHETVEHALARANHNTRPVVNKRFLDHNSHAVTPTDVEASLVDATMLVRREVLEHVQFANCYMGNAWREESDFQLTAQELGFSVFFCPHALFFHYDRYKTSRGNSRLKDNINYLYWIFKNNHTFLQRHRAYLTEKIPESLVFGSPVISSIAYILFRSIWLTKGEIRRIWQYYQFKYSNKASG